MKCKAKIWLITAYLASIILPVFPKAQVPFTNTGIFTVTGTTPLAINGDFTNTSTGTWTNNGVVTLMDNVTNDQSAMAAGTGLTNLTGASLQTLGGSQPFITNNLFLSNGAGFMLNQILRAEGNVTLSKGIVATGAATTPFVFGAAAVVTGASDTGHVNGFVRRLGANPFTFPVGDGIFYRPIDITPSTNGSGIDCKYFKVDAGIGPFTGGGGSPVPLIAYDIHEYWDLSPVSTATSTVTLHYDQVVPPGPITDITGLRVAHKSGGNWLDEGGSAVGSTTAGSITSDPVSTWSPFTLGSISLGNLPVTLQAFSGMLVDHAAQLQWEVADETGFKGYGVERSCNGTDFNTIGEVMATNGHTYRYEDANIPCRVAYYRLRLEDQDGRYSFSHIVALNTAVSSSISVMPNPVEDKMAISFGAGTGGTYEISLIDMGGRKVLNSEKAISDGQTIIINRSSGIQSGNYVLFLKNKEKGVTNSFKILIK